ncbi:hypothetical protein OQA88_9112 [Cercophora sp. LCS_1]
MPPSAADVEYRASLDKLYADFTERATEAGVERLRRFLAAEHPHENVASLLPKKAEVGEKLECIRHLEEYWRKNSGRLTDGDQLWYRAFNDLHIATLLLMPLNTLKRFSRGSESVKSLSKDILLRRVGQFVQVIKLFQEARSTDFKQFVLLETRASERSSPHTHGCVLTGTANPNICRIYPSYLRWDAKTKAQVYKYYRGIQMLIPPDDGQFDDFAEVMKEALDERDQVWNMIVSINKLRTSGEDAVSHSSVKALWTTLQLRMSVKGMRAAQAWSP